MVQVNRTCNFPGKSLILHKRGSYESKKNSNSAISSFYFVYYADRTKTIKEQRTMNITKKFRIFLLSILIAGCPVVVIHAQELIAVHPLRAAPGTEELARYFYLTMLQQIPFVDDTDFRPFPIDLTRLPPDVPAGGFPPWVCPSPVITGGASYALTGESVPDADAPGNVRIRLYLWRMEGARLLGSDEMTVSGRADIEMATPFFLEWVFSWIEPTAEPETIVLTERERVYVEVEVERIVEVKRFVDVGIRQPYEPSWLYLGIRLG
ncbi:MAG: hypothetical protein FWC36_10465, partial [Spirochaetes bacterium]|nr:hypothetical protein [Spirochaetota bacterium]